MHFRFKEITQPGISQAAMSGNDFRSKKRILIVADTNEREFN